MKKLRITLAVWILALAGAPAHAQLAVGQDLSERIEVNTVNVEVSVSDKNGRPVTGLQRRDFELREDGKPVQIANFDAVVHRAAAVPASPGKAAPGPVLEQTAEGAPAGAGEGFAEPASWVLYIDDASIEPASRARVLRQLGEFLTQQLAPGDQVMVATYDLGLKIRLPFTKDRESLHWALDQVAHLSAKGGELDRARHHILAELLSEQESESMATGKKGPKLTRARDQEILGDDEGGGPGGQPGCPQSVSQSARSYAASLHQQVLGSVDGLTLLVNSLAGLPGRKVILHVSDGIPATPGEEIFEVVAHLCGDQGSVLSGRYFGTQAALDAQDYGTVPEWTALAAHANAQRVTLYTFQASGAGAGGMSADMGPEDRLLTLPSVTAIETANRQQPLSVLANETGGRAIFWANDFLPDLARMQEDLASYYSLGFTPVPYRGRPRAPQLEVKVKRPGCGLRYRQSYRDKPALEKDGGPHPRRALLRHRGQPAGRSRWRSARSSPAEGGHSPCPSASDPALQAGHPDRKNLFEGKLRLLVATRDDAGGTLARAAGRGAAAHPPQGGAERHSASTTSIPDLKMKPGVQHVAVAVRDETTTTTSYLARTLHIGDVEAK